MANVTFYVGIPIANVIKFTVDSLPKNQRASFDQQSFDQSVHASTEENSFALPFEKSDPLRPQFYTNFPAVKLELIKVFDNKETFISDGFPAIAKSYINKKYRSTCQFSSINGKLFIYFEEGPIYLDDGFTVQGEIFDHEGRLPNVNVKVGDLIRYKIGTSAAFDFTEVVSIEWLPALQAQGFLTDVDYNIFTPVEGIVEITYDEKPTNLYAHAVSLIGLEDGCYKVRLKFGISHSSYSAQFTSEPMDVRDEHPKSLALIYSHVGQYSRADIWQYEYLNDWTNQMRLPSEFYKFEPAGEVEVYLNDAGKPDVTRAVPFRQMVFTAFHIPSWLVDKLNVIFSHDTKKINGYHWENENFGSKDNIERTDISTFSIQLKQVEDRTIFNNEFTAEIDASWTPSSFTNLAFGGVVVAAVFNSSLTDSVFRFRSLPNWITPDVESFSDGDTVNFTIAANAVAFERTEILVAVTDVFDDLLVPLSFHQLYDTTIPPPVEHLEVEDENVQLNYPAGSNRQIGVSASGDYTISFSGAHTFVAVKENGFLNIRISEPTANHGTADRTGTVRLTLDSNNAIFVDITVTQFFRPEQILSLTPALGQTIGENGEAFSIFVDVLEAGTQWQAIAVGAWAQANTFFNTSVQIGDNGAFLVTANGRPPYIPPGTVMTINFINVMNPADLKTFTIQQN